MSRYFIELSYKGTNYSGFQSQLNTNKTIQAELEKAFGILQKEKVDIGTIAVDAIFTPIRRVSYEVENMRVGERTDFNRLRLMIETDGSISPSASLRKASNILQDHFAKVSQIEVKEVAPKEKAEEKPKAKAKKEKKVTKAKKTKKKCAKLLKKN